MIRSRGLCRPLPVLAVLVLVSPALAQIDTYSSTHPFSLATATTTRLFGMGGFATCVRDAGFANPAFAGTLTDVTAVIRQSTTTFDSGLKLKGEQFSVAVPLKENKRGFQVVGFRLKTEDALPMATPPSSLTMSEYDIALHYGQRISRRFVLGLGVSPVYHNGLDSTLVGGASALRLRASAGTGCRIAALYDWGDDGWIGAVWDRYDEDVTASGLLVGSVPVKASFDSEEIIVGASHRLNPSLLAAVEWQQLSSENASSWRGDAGWRAGLEATMDNNITMRLGTNDGALSLGVGLRGQRWNLNYAFVKDWNDDTVGASLGGSKTHQLEAAYCF